jgi:hypothetical protein
VIGLLKNERGIALAVLTMLIAILASMTGAALLFSRIDLMISSNFKRGTGALYAADAGVAKALDQITAAQGKIADAVAQFGPIAIDGYSYRSGTRSDTGPQPFVYTGSGPAVGSSLGSGMGGGFVVDNYVMNITGTGPLGSSAREIQALGQYGPRPNN